MSNGEDAFDRAVRREAGLRRSDEQLDATWDQIRRIAAWYAAGFACWLPLLVVHWVVFSDPRWLAVAHTIVFVGTLGYAAFQLLITRTIFRRRNIWFPGR